MSYVAPTLSGPSALWRGLWEGGKEVQSTIVHQREGDGDGAVSETAREILPGGKNALPPPEGPGLGAFEALVMGAPDAPPCSPGLSLPTSTREEGPFGVFSSRRRPGGGPGPGQGAPEGRKIGRAHV